MTSEPVYTFDQQSMRRISKAVQKSEGAKDRKGNKWYPIKGTGSTLQIGKTKAGEPWDKGKTAIVTVYNKKDRTSTGQDSKEIFNLFADVEAEKWVAWIDGYLIAAECPEEEEEEGG